MRTIAIHFFAVCIATLFAVPAGYASDTKPEDPKALSAASKVAFYKPPLRGAPASRLGGGTRSGGKEDTISVLAPDHTGLTTRAQPTLYWYASGSSVGSIELVIIEANAEKPALVKSIPLTQAGLYAFDLGKETLQLKPDTEYEWFVSVVRDPAQRSQDITSGSTIRRVAEATVATDATDRQAAIRLAEAGLWYDSLDSVSRLIAANPGDADLRDLRADLLDQVGLQAAATFARAAR